MLHIRPLLIRLHESNTTQYPSGHLMINTATPDPYATFCQAIDKKCNEAWESIVKQYNDLILHWIIQTECGVLSPYEIEEVKQNVLIKYWSCLSNSPAELSHRFEKVEQLLCYLKKCTVTSTIDFLRRKNKQSVLRKKVESNLSQPHQSGACLEDELSYQADDACNQLRIWLRSQVTDPQEQLLLYLTFDLDLKPRQIATRFPEQFHDIADVYRIKERLIKRARRTLMI